MIRFVPKIERAMKTLDPKLLATITATHRRMTEALSEIAKPIAFDLPVHPFPEIEGIAVAVKSIVPDYRGSFADIARPLAWLEPYFAQMTIGMRQSSALTKAGWLPHATLPIGIVDEHLDDPQRLSNTLEGYYRQNWPQVCEKLHARVQSYSIEDEARACYGEIVDAHGYSLYRMVCPKVFTEIERVVRAELYGDDLSITITSQQRLQKFASELDPDVIDLREFFHLEIFKKFTEHSYAHVKTKQAREQISLDAVPNRHAALHGIVPYNSFKSSLNAIFLLDYVFQVITAFKQEKARVANCPAQ